LKGTRRGKEGGSFSVAWMGWVLGCLLDGPIHILDSGPGLGVYDVLVGNRFMRYMYILTSLRFARIPCPLASL
jgi:hypothetical protein